MKTPRVTFKIEKAFVVWTNTDLTEGRGTEYPLAFCKLMATAKRLAKGRYVMGTDCRITEEEVFVKDHVHYGRIVFDPFTPEDVHEEKLIELEKENKRKFDEIMAKAKALGLTDEEIEHIRSIKA